jgi:hypothetical protein
VPFRSAPPHGRRFGGGVPHLLEPWFCCGRLDGVCAIRPGAEAGEAPDRVEDLRPGSPVALPRRDDLQHGGLESVDLRIAATGRRVGRRRKADHRGHFWQIEEQGSGRYQEAQGELDRGHAGNVAMRSRNAP